MAFTSTATYEDFTSKHRVIGTFTNTGGSTGGTIQTGMKKVLHINLNDSTSATCPYASSLSGGNAVIVTAANATGTFEAIGI